MFWFTNEWYIFPGVIDKTTCDRIIKQGEGQFSPASVASESPQFDPDYRTSDVAWTREQWVYDLIWPYMIEANQNAGWNLEIHIAEDMQITRYKKDGFYAWHRDGLSDNSPVALYDSPGEQIHGKARKMSMSLILNDDFEGGEFEFCCYNGGECEITPIELKAGDMIFFTSGMEHRIKPVTKGTRYSLVSWFLGPPIR